MKSARPYTKNKIARAGLHIVIIGDSWGVPRPDPHYAHRQQQHTQGLLLAQGHRVTAFAQDGSTNHTQLVQALKSGIAPDWIIWFHTELTRDFGLARELDTYTLEGVLEHLARATYPLWSDLAARATQGTIVIGGQAPVHPVIHSMGGADLIIQDWRSNILGVDLPVHSLCQPEIIDSDRCINPMKQKAQIIDDHSRLLNLMQKSPLFPDDCHPGPESYQMLHQHTIGKLIC